MKSSTLVALAAVILVQINALLVDKQPIFKGKVDSDSKFAVSAQSDKPVRPPGYRNAWDDCGGVGASATERMRSIAAKIKGWAKPIPFKRHAAQDCGTASKSGTKPGPGKQVNYPGPEVMPAARAGLRRADETLSRLTPSGLLLIVIVKCIYNWYKIYLILVAYFGRYSIHESLRCDRD